MANVVTEKKVIRKAEIAEDSEPRVTDFNSYLPYYRRFIVGG